jgi:nitrogen fixation NifU-like protein
VKALASIYSESAVSHILNPRNLGELEKADGFARGIGPCGDTMQFCLKVRSGKIIDVNFVTDGCPATVACGSATTELARGKTVTEALDITRHDTLDVMNGLPEAEAHCSLLAANTLRAARADCLSLQREPWERAYRRTEPFWAGKCQSAGITASAKGDVAGRRTASTRRGTGSFARGCSPPLNAVRSREQHQGFGLQADLL